MKSKFLSIAIFLLLLFLASCSSTPKINLVDSMGLSMELKAPAYQVVTVGLSPEGNYGLSTGFEKKIRLWDLQEGRQINMLTGHTGDVYAAAFSPDTRYILSGGWDPVVRLWDFSSGKEIKQFTGSKGDMVLGVMVRAVAFSPDGRKVLSGSLNSTTLWDIETAKPILTLPIDHVFDARFTADGRYVLTGGRAAYVTLWDAATGKSIRHFKHSVGFAGISPVNSVDISPDGRLVLSGSQDGIIKLYNFTSGNEIRAFKAHSGMNGIAKARFSSDGKYILSSGGDNALKLWEISSGKEIRTFSGHASGTLGVGWAEGVISPDGKKALSGGIDAAVRLWDVATGEEIAIMIGFEDGEWLVITREGYYNSSERGAQYLLVKAGDQDFTVDQFYDVFYRPDIVAAKLKGSDIGGLVTITMQDAIKSPPPKVEITRIAETGAAAKIYYQVRDAGGGIGEVRLFHNGKLIRSDGYYRDMAGSAPEKQQLIAMNSKAIYENMRSVAVKGKADFSPVTSRSKGEFFEDWKEVEAVPGENEISVAAFNQDNTVQSYMKTVKFNSTVKPREPHLYILSIGIDKYNDGSINLKYAAKDASDLEQALLRQSATVYKPRNIHYELLADDKATKKNITGKIDELSGIIKPDDGFVLFVAGHGVLLQNQYYMLTHDYEGSVREDNMISSNEIVEMSKKIKSLSQLFIFDTCHAGGVDTIVSGLYDARMSVLAKKMGLHIYASASSMQEAQDGYQGNGLFTYTLLDGLNNRKEADKNNDSKISMVELGGYAKQVTTERSKEIGHTQTPLIINFGKDNPVYHLK